LKPPPFGYSRPETLAEALAVLAAQGEDGKVLAGGQSLVPLLSMRLASPGHLIDINRLPGLAYVRVTSSDQHTVGTRAERAIKIGALARHAEVLADPAAAAAQPLLAQALRLVAHPAIRNRGTTVGSIVHADPSGEMTAVLALLRGTVRVASEDGEREIGASDFFLGPLESAVEPTELAVEASFPVLPPGAGTAFAEVSRRHGDYAVCGVGVIVQLDGEGRLSQARAAYLSVAPVPLVVDLTETVAGLPAGTAEFPEAAALAQAKASPQSDIHATASYRRHLAGVLTQRALAEAAAHARGRQAGEGQVPHG
jgi:carbon-monoxide dehydrogenase medium subunit